jgi:hypothetical protein
MAMSEEQDDKEKCSGDKGAEITMSAMLTLHETGSRLPLDWAIDATTPFQSGMICCGGGSFLAWNASMPHHWANVQ